MEVPSVTGTPTSNKTGATSSTSSLASGTVDYNTFLKLLIAEMKNQDPTNPTDTAQYMTQFAEFSQVEQAMATNSKLDTLLSTSALDQADSLIGHTISFISTDGKPISGQIASISIVSGGALANLTDGQSVQLGDGVTIS